MIVWIWLVDSSGSRMYCIAWRYGDFVELLTYWDENGERIGTLGTPPL